MTSNGVPGRDAAPNRSAGSTGSDLAPEHIARQLKTRWLGRDYRFYSSLDSTNSKLSALATQGFAEGAVLLADEQHRGRGRLGRTWIAATGESLTFSILLKPTCAPAEMAPLALAVAVGVAVGIGEVVDLPLVLKWPNDLLCDGKKLAGILIETSGDGKNLRHLIVGVGINVNQSAFPEELGGQASSLRLATGKNQSRPEILLAVLRGLEKWIDLWRGLGSAPIIDAWLKYAPWVGEEIEVKTSTGIECGVAVGLNPTGALILEDGLGHRREIHSGDVTLIGSV
jgi:BirA family transcriptional regulator, biotin operon repressor / biotin---[acetyl-CoA-carboxylase] ligase